MRLTTKSRYGTRMILDLAMHPEDGYIPLSEISKRQNISLKYLEKLIQVMRMPRDTEIFVSSESFLETIKNGPKADVNIFGTTMEDIKVADLRNLAGKVNSTVLFIRDSKHTKAIS
mgnify:CR=1 FL=1